MDKAARRALNGFLSGLFWAAAGGLAMAIALFCFFKFSPYALINVHGPSMESTFYDGDVLIIGDEEPSRGQIAVFTAPPEWTKLIGEQASSVIKRIVAVPGDTLSFEGTELKIKGASGEVFTVSEPAPESCSIPIGTELIVPNGSYVMAGDNRLESFDSLAAWCQGMSPLIDESLIGISGKVTFKLKGIGS